MFKFLLDMPAEPTFTERARSHTWLIVLAVAALVGLVVFFIWKQRKNSKHKQ